VRTGEKKKHRKNIESAWRNYIKGRPDNERYPLGPLPPLMKAPNPEPSYLYDLSCNVFFQVENPDRPFLGKRSSR